MIAEAAEAEPLPQAGLLDFDPANSFQIARGHAQQSAFPGQVAQYVFHARHQRQVQFVTPLGNAVAHRLKNRIYALFQELGGNSRLVACFAQDRRIGVAVQQDAGQRNLKTRHPMHARGERVNMYPVAAAQKRAVNVEEIGVLPIPGEIRLYRDAGCGILGVVDMMSGCVSPGSFQLLAPLLAVALAKRADIQDVRCAADA